MLEIRCDVCGEKMPGDCEFMGYPMLTIFRGNRLRLEPNVYSDNSYNMELDLCPKCANTIKDDILDLKNKMAMRKKEDKHGYEKIQETDDPAFDQLREVVRDTRPGGRIR